MNLAVLYVFLWSFQFLTNVGLKHAVGALPYWLHPTQGRIIKLRFFAAVQRGRTRNFAGQNIEKGKRV